MKAFRKWFNQKASSVYHRSHLSKAFANSALLRRRVLLRRWFVIAWTCDGISSIDLPRLHLLIIAASCLSSFDSFRQHQPMTVALHLMMSEKRMLRLVCSEWIHDLLSKAPNGSEVVTTIDTSFSLSLCQIIIRSSSVAVGLFWRDYKKNVPYVIFNSFTLRLEYKICCECIVIVISQESTNYNQLLHHRLTWINLIYLMKWKPVVCPLISLQCDRDRGPQPTTFDTLIIDEWVT
jgi:hypothetical protein